MTVRHGDTFRFPRMNQYISIDFIYLQSNQQAIFMGSAVHHPVRQTHVKTAMMSRDGASLTENSTASHNTAAYSVPSTAHMASLGWYGYHGSIHPVQNQWQPSTSASFDNPRHTLVPSQQHVGHATGTSWYKQNDSRHTSQSFTHTSTHNSAHVAAVQAAAQVLAKRSPRHNAQATNQTPTLPTHAPGISPEDTALPMRGLLKTPALDNVSGIKVLIPGGQSLRRMKFPHQSESVELDGTMQAVQLPPSPKSHTPQTPLAEQPADGVAAPVLPPSRTTDRWLLQETPEATPKGPRGGLDAIRPPVTVCVGFMQQQSEPRPADSHAAVPMVHAGSHSGLAIHSAQQVIVPMHTHSGDFGREQQVSPWISLPNGPVPIVEGSSVTVLPLGTMHTASNGHSWPEPQYQMGFWGPNSSTASPFAHAQMAHPTTGGLGNSAIGTQMTNSVGGPAASFASALEDQAPYQIHPPAAQHGTSWPQQALQGMWQPMHQAPWQAVDSPRAQFMPGGYTTTPAAAYASGYAAAIAAASMQSQGNNTVSPAHRGGTQVNGLTADITSSASMQQQLLQTHHIVRQVGPLDLYDQPHGPSGFLPDRMDSLSK